MAGAAILPYDLRGYLLGTDDLIQGPLPLVMLLVLQFVSRGLRKAVMLEGSLSQSHVLAYRNAARCGALLDALLTETYCCGCSSPALLLWLKGRLRWNFEHAAVAAGRTELLVRNPISGISRSAAFWNLRSLVEWALSQDAESGGEAIQAAAARGHMSLLRWLHELRHCPFGPYSLRSAVQSGNLEIAKYVANHGGELERDRWGCSDTLLSAAASTGNVELMRWLCEEQRARWQESIFSNRICANAALAGHLDLLKYVRSRRCPWDVREISVLTLQSGQLEVLKWCVNEWRLGGEFFSRLTPYPFHPQVSQAAQLAILQYLVEQNPDIPFRMLLHSAPDSPTVMGNAARGGHVDTLRFLRSHGCAWEPDVLLSACQSGAQAGLMTVQYLLDAGYAVSDRERSQLARVRHHGMPADVEAYLVERAVLPPRAEEPDTEGIGWN